ncbi:MAG: hypothetical protein OEZ43_02295 [Gammaproteobacteria bacterium]|nr:hypothetical protein [Gammaproteobacteria bacterium]
MKSGIEKLDSVTTNEGTLSSSRRAQLENYMYGLYLTDDFPKHAGNDVEQSKNGLALPETCSPTLLAAISLFLVVDAILSVVLLNMGNTQHLSLLQILAKADFAFFFMIKSVVTAGFIGVVAIYRHYTSLAKITGRRLLSLAFLAYSLLLIYELRLVW